MKSLLAIIVTAVLGLLSIMFGNSQRKKRKAAEEKTKSLEAELKLKEQQAKVSDEIHAEQVGAISEIVAAPDKDLVDDANNLFTGSSPGKELESKRLKLGLSLLDASKATGYTVVRILEIEKDKDIGKDDIEKMGKAYGLDQEEIRHLQSELKAEPLPVKTDSSNSGGEKKR